MRHDRSLDVPLRRWVHGPRLVSGPPALIAVRDPDLRISICAALVTEGFPTVVGRRVAEIASLLPLAEVFIAELRFIRAMQERAPAALELATVVAISNQQDTPRPAGAVAIFYTPFAPNDLDDLVTVALKARM